VEELVTADVLTLDAAGAHTCIFDTVNIRDSWIIIKINGSQFP